MVIKPKDYSSTRHKKADFSIQQGEKSKPHWTWRVLKFKIWLLMIFAIIALIGVAWFSSAPRSIAFISDYLLDQLRQDIAPYQLETSQANVHLDIKHSRLVITLDDIIVKGDSGHTLAEMPELRINLQALPLLAGYVRIHELVLLRPNIHLYRQEDGSLSFNLTEHQDDDITANKSIIDSQNPNNLADSNEIFEMLNTLALKHMTLKYATIKLGKGTNKTLWTIPKLQISTIIGNSKEFDIYTEIGANTQNKATILDKNKLTKSLSTLSGRFRFGNELQSMEASLKVEGFAPSMLGNIDWHFSRLKNLDMRFDGTVAIFTSPESKTSNIRMELVSNGGTLSDKSLFESPLTISKITVKSQLTNDLSNLRIDQLDINFPQGDIAIKGDVMLTSNGVGLNLDTQLNDIPIDDLRNIWPIPLAPVTRKWVTENMSAGAIKSGKAIIHLNPKDSNKRPFPTDFIKASLELKNASVRYKPSFPLVTGVNGGVEFTGRSMKVKASSGRTMNSAVLKSGTVEISDFFANGVPINIDLDVKANAKDIARFMDKDHLDIAPHIKLNSSKVSGKVSGKVLMNFPLYSKAVKKYYFNYDINTNLKDVSQNGLLGKWDISNFSGNIYAFNDGLKLNGKTGLNGIASEIEIIDQYRPKKQTDYKLKAKLMADQLPLFGVEKPSFLNGMIEANVEIIENASGSITNAKLNLKNASIDLDVIKWKKPVDEAANAVFSHYKLDDNEVINDLHFVSDSLSTKGDIIISSKDGILRSLKLDYLRFGGNDSAVNYHLEGESEHIALLGNKFDLSPWLDTDDKANSANDSEVVADNVNHNPFEFFNNKLITLKLNSLKLGKSRDIIQVNGHIDCRGKVCESVAFNANYPKGKGFNFSINSSDGKRKLSLVSSDASEFMNIIDMSKYVRGGGLSYEGYFDDNRQGSPLDARLLMTDFNVIKGGVLTKLLTIGSLTGLIDTLQGNGIWFKKLIVNGVFHNGKVTLQNGRAFGNAVGITGEGELQPFVSKVNIRGAIVPSYTANSILGKIPLLGTILTGGKGEGIIAMNYSMSGNSKDPNISVNPLSLLTPGFLRKLFDVLETGGDEAAKVNK